MRFGLVKDIFVYFELSVKIPREILVEETAGEIPGEIPGDSRKDHQEESQDYTLKEFIKNPKRILEEFPGSIS